MRRLAEITLPCAVCLKEKGVDGYHVEPPPGTSGRWHPAWTLVEGGAWRRYKVCAGSKDAQVLAKLGMSDTLVCYECGKMKPRSNYDMKTLETLYAACTPWRAVCLLCDPALLRTQPAGEDKTFLCVRCKSLKPASAFEVTWLKKHSKECIIAKFCLCHKIKETLTVFIVHSSIC